MEQFMIIKLVSITLVFIVLTSEVSASPARSRAVVASKTANKLSPDRSGTLSFKKLIYHKIFLSTLNLFYKQQRF